MPLSGLAHADVRTSRRALVPSHTHEAIQLFPRVQQAPEIGQCLTDPDLTGPEAFQRPCHEVVLPGLTVIVEIAHVLMLP